jgi:hypothetical protein
MRVAMRLTYSQRLLVDLVGRLLSGVLAWLSQLIGGQA